MEHDGIPNQEEMEDEVLTSRRQQPTLPSGEVQRPPITTTSSDIQMASLLKSKGVNSSAKLQIANLQRQLFEQKQQQKLAELKNAATEEKNRSLERELEQFQNVINSNSYSRPGFGKPLDARAAAHAGSPSNIFAFAEQMHCLCADHHCGFCVGKNMKLRTISPTQFLRMLRLLEKFPQMQKDPEAVKMITQGNLMDFMEMNLPKGPPTLEEFKQMAHCPSLFLLVKTIPGWEVAYSGARAKLMEDLVGSNPLLQQTLKVITIIAPITGEEKIPIYGRHVIQMESWNDAERIVQVEFEKESFNLAVVIMPFQKEQLSEEEPAWMELLRMIPDHTEVLLLPMPSADFTYSDIPSYDEMFCKATRPEDAKIHAIAPGTPMEAKKDKPMVMLRETCDTLETWELIYEKVKALGLSWPGFKLKKQKDHIKEKGRMDREVEDSEPRSSGRSGSGAQTAGHANMLDTKQQYHEFHSSPRSNRPLLKRTYNNNYDYDHQAPSNFRRPRHH